MFISLFTEQRRTLGYYCFLLSVLRERETEREGGGREAENFLHFLIKKTILTLLTFGVG